VNILNTHIEFILPGRLEQVNKLNLASVSLLYFKIWSNLV